MKLKQSFNSFCLVVVVAAAALALSQLDVVRYVFAQSSESTLSAVRRSDVSSKDAQGNITRLTPAEHMRRAAIYMSNRAFAEARQHWESVINYYPQDSRVPEAMLGVGRSYFQAKDYSRAYSELDALARKYSSLKEGREGLHYSAAALLRLGRFQEAADRYADYITRFPKGERIDTAHLNVIDTLREANRPQDALMWTPKTKQRLGRSA